MNYLKLGQKFRRDVGVQGTGPTSMVGQTGHYQRIADFIADADDEIQALFEDWDFLRATTTFTTSAALATYTKTALNAANVAKWDRKSFAFNANTVDFRPLDHLDFYDWMNSGDRYGVNVDEEPNQFTVDADESLILVPTPDAAYACAIDRWDSPTRMVLDEDISAIPARFHQAIIELAKMKYGVYDENPTLISEGLHQFKEVWLPRIEASELRGRKRAYASSDDGFDIVVE